jgi:hypothetical protein
LASSLAHFEQLPLLAAHAKPVSSWQCLLLPFLLTSSLARFKQFSLLAALAKPIQGTFLLIALFEFNSAAISTGNGSHTQLITSNFYSPDFWMLMPPSITGKLQHPNNILDDITAL